MNVNRTHSGRLLLEFDVAEGRRLAKAIRRHAGETTNACLEMASLLSAAYYYAGNHFRQPPHAFDEQARRVPSVGD